jgi:AcrR family transcriptional regulator
LNKAESKYFNTAVRFDKALLSLLEKKPFEYITISEICEDAEVNRSTFYLHYENTTDLLKEATQHILSRFQSYFKTDLDSISNRFTQTERQDLLFITPEYLNPYLTFIRDNRRLFKTVMREFGSMGFDQVYHKMFTYIFDPILARFDFPANTRTYVMKFYLSGITAIAMEWLDGDCHDSIETIIAIITECVLGKLNIDGQKL